MMLQSYFLLNFRTIKARAWVRTLIFRDKSALWISLASTLVSTASYVFVYKALKAPTEFIGFALLGGMMTVYWSAVLWSMGSQFYWEKQDGQLTLHLIAPCSRFSILLGMAFGGIYGVSFQAILTFLLGSWFFGVPAFPENWILTLTLFSLTLIALFGMGCLLASLFLLYGREAWHTINLVEQPAYILSGFYFPVKHLGFWIAAAASVIPLTLGLDGLRQLFYRKPDLGFLSVDKEIWILLGLCIFFFWLANLALKFFEHHAKRTGSLTLQWQ